MRRFGYPDDRGKRCDLRGRAGTRPGQAACVMKRRPRRSQAIWIAPRLCSAKPSARTACRPRLLAVPPRRRGRASPVEHPPTGQRPDRETRERQLAGARLRSGWLHRIAQAFVSTGVLTDAGAPLRAREHLDARRRVALLQPVAAGGGRRSMCRRGLWRPVSMLVHHRLRFSLTRHRPSIARAKRALDQGALLEASRTPVRALDTASVLVEWVRTKTEGRPAVSTGDPRW